MGRTHLLTGLALASLLAGCGSGNNTVAADNTSTSGPSAAGQATSTSASTVPAAGAATTANIWKGTPVDLTKLPIGTAHVSTRAPSRGGLFACSAGNPNGGGASRAGVWIDEAAGTWDATKKVSVRGSVSWPTAKYQEMTRDGKRVVLSSGVPLHMVTGTFPIASDDPAYAVDRNPNSIAPYTLSLTLPLIPKVATTAGCLAGGIIGVAKNGVALFAPLDERNRDAAAYETQDVCDGHPQQARIYHYHEIPSCILDASTGPSTVVGYAIDGYPIVVERNAAGELPTNADLDACHGRTSPVVLDTEIVTTYHYSATREFPYFIGCYHGATS